MNIYTVEAKNPFVKMLVYAPPGAGKTKLAATAQEHPAMKNVLFANADGGLLTVSKKGVFAVDIKTSTDLETLIFDLNAGKLAEHEIQTIVIDSVTEMQIRELRMIAAREHAKSDSKRESIDFQDISDYKEMNTRLTRIFSWFKDAPYHIIFTALAKFVYPRVDTRKVNKEEQAPIAVMPRLTDGLGNDLMAKVDFAWYLYVDGDGKRQMLTQDKGVYKAKTRGEYFAPKLGLLVEDPNLADIYNLLLETEGT